MGLTNNIRLVTCLMLLFGKSWASVSDLVKIEIFPWQIE